MISFEEEIEALRARGELPDAEAATVLAIERRDVFSVHSELRLLTWAAVMMIVAGVGMVLKNNLDRIGPVVLILLVGVAAAACYVWTWMRRQRRAGVPSLLDDYVLLLGALILSADVGYAESELHLFGDRWAQHLLILAFLHALTAYAFDSSRVLTVAVTSLVAWLGVGPGALAMLHTPLDLGLRALIGAALLLLWRTFNASIPSRAHFHSVFDHYAALLGLVGALLLLFDSSTDTLGIIILVLFSAASIAHAFRSRKEAFAIYGVLALLIGLLEQFTVRVRPSEVVGILSVLLAVVGAAMTLFMIHARLRSDA